METTKTTLHYNVSAKKAQIPGNLEGYREGLIPAQLKLPLNYNLNRIKHAEADTLEAKLKLPALGLKPAATHMSLDEMMAANVETIQNSSQEPRNHR